MIDRGREVLCAVAPVPTDMSVELTGYKWAQDTIGESGADVYRLHGAANAPDLFLKHGRDAVSKDVIDEMTRLKWLSTHMPVPHVRHFIHTSGEAWLLMSAMPGRTAYQMMEAELHEKEGAIQEAVDAYEKALSIDARIGVARKLEKLRKSLP